MYDKFRIDFDEVLSSGFCAEILGTRKYFDVLLSSISGDAHKDLEIDIHALEAFRNIRRSLKTCCNSIATQIVDQTKVTKSAIDIVLNIMRDNTSIKIITQNEFIDKKKPDRIVVMKDEIERTSKSKKFPAKWSKEYAHMQYVTDTYSFESLFFVLRDIMMNPLYPNTLAICEYKMLGHSVRFDIYGGISDESIVESDFNKPFKNPSPPTNMFLVGDEEMREKGIPFSISDYHTLFAVSAQDVGLFRKFFKNFECAKAYESQYDEINMTTLLSVTGYSIFNKYKRMRRQTPLWHCTYDYIFTGMEYDIAMERFAELLVKYAVFLYRESECVIAGFFSDTDPDYPALSVYKVKTEDDIANASQRIYEYYNNRIRLYLRVLAPVEATFKMIKIYFNMHYRVSEDAKIASLLPLTSINDVTKVFFTLDEFVLWDKVLSGQPNYEPTNHLLDEYKNAYISFKLIDALKCRILVQIKDENIDSINHFMRILYSPAETLLNLSDSVQIVYQLIKDYSYGEQNKIQYKKFDLKEIAKFWATISQDIEAVMLDNHNTICEGNQIKIINHVYEIDLYIEGVEDKPFPDNMELFELIMSKARSIETDLRMMSNMALLYCSEYLKSSHQINLFDNPLIIE